MRSSFFLIILIVLYTTSSKAQSPLPTNSAMFKPYDKKVWDQQAISRVSDVGRLWGVIKYFHPEILNGNLDPDRLLLDNINPLLKNPTQQNFLVTVNKMLLMLHDTSSRILTPVNAHSYHYQPIKTAPSLKDVKYLAFPQIAFEKEQSLDSYFSGSVSESKSFIIDLRNLESNDPLGIKQYQQLVQPLIASVINETLVLPMVRSVYYHAMLRQDFQDELDVIPSDKRESDPNYWYQERFGYKNTSQGAYILAKPDLNYLNKRFCFIVNQFDNPNTLKALLALRNKNLCNLIFDGPMPDYLSGDFYTMNLSDDVVVKVKVAERIYENGTAGTSVDLNGQSLTQDEILQKAASLLAQPVSLRVQNQLNNVVIRLPQQAYAEDLYPETKLRLLGLFNFWNVIHYFCPNKKLISGSWDEALNYFVTRFLYAKDYKAYYWQLRELLSRLNDGHAEVTLNYSIVPPKGINEFYTPFCVEHAEGKTVIVRLVKDTLVNAKSGTIMVGDILTAIDDIPVAQLYHNWAKYIDSTNADNYFRILHKVQLVSRAGADKFKIKVIRDGKELEVVLHPVSAEAYFKEFSQVYYPPVSRPYWKVINDSIGYVRVNSIKSTQVDSVWHSLKNVKFLIIDARGYPKDNDIVKTISAPFITQTDTVCINAFPEITHPLLTRNAITLEQETVSPIPFRVDMSKVKKFIVLCASGNGSQAETNIISWQKVLKPVTIGTPTVGANGVSNTVLLPGGYAGHYSGFAVYYPDGTPNQGLGVKIDIPVKLTIKGVLEGNDEILEKALQYINDNK